MQNSLNNCCCSLAQSCPTLYDPMNCSLPGFPVLAISWSSPKLLSIESVMPSNRLILCRPLLLLPSIFPSIRVFSMSWLFTSDGQSIGVSASASVLPMNIQNWFPLGLTDLASLQSKGLSRVCTSTTIQKYQFFNIQPSLWSNSHICTWLLEKPLLWLYGSQQTVENSDGKTRPPDLPPVKSVCRSGTNS